MAKGKVRVMKAGELKVDPRVQRAVDETQVKRLIAEWDDDYAGALIGSQRDDGFVYLLDGYQRKTALVRAGLPDYTIPVVVHTGLTIQEEAEIFLATNRGRKNVTPYWKFHVGLAAEDPVAVAVNEVVESLGFHVAPASSEKGIGCVATLERIVGKSGRSIDEQKVVLERAIAMFHEVWGNSGMDWWRGEVLEGLAIFYSKHLGNPILSEASLKRNLRKMTVSQMLTKAKARSERSNRVSPQVAAVIEDLYDSGKKPENRLRLVA